MVVSCQFAFDSRSNCSKASRIVSIRAELTAHQARRVTNPRTRRGRQRSLRVSQHPFVPRAPTSRPRLYTDRLHHDTPSRRYCSLIPCHLLPAASRNVDTLPVRPRRLKIERGQRRPSAVASGPTISVDLHGTAMAVDVPCCITQMTSWEQNMSRSAPLNSRLFRRSIAISDSCRQRISVAESY